MRLPPFVITSTEHLLREMMRFTAPADGVMSRYFRENPRLGGRDRSAIAEAAYCVLRQRLIFANMAESGGGNAMRSLAILGLAEGMGAEELSGLTDDEVSWLDRMQHISRDSFAPDVRCNLPKWLYDSLCTEYGAEQTQVLSDALNQPAPLDLRVNVLKASLEEVEEELAKAPISTTRTPYSPTGLRVIKKPALQNLPLYKSGAIEVQDEGSQLLAQIVGARRGEMVVDFCAGAGGKTLALGAMMRNTGRLYAFDVSEKRLANLKPRLARSGLSNVHPTVIAHERDARIKRMLGKADRVLVDAPCSGLGTLRRNPDVKWRQSPDDVAEMADLQFRILDSAARMVKSGGRLVYGTCSLLKAENDDVATRFLETHPEFTLLSVADILSSSKIALDTGEYLKLLPHIHQTDGFFAAAFVRQ